MNFFNHDTALPDLYWTGETRMKCMRMAVGQSLKHAYAHHIQRLMVTGNFALLAGVHPDEVDAWYLGIYIDAIQWVELPNTRAMSQFADGGLIATKPYISSAKYIHTMSDYCEICEYDWKKRIKNAFFIIMGAFFTTIFAMVPLLLAGAGLLKGFAIITMIGAVIGVFIARPAYAAVIEVLLKE